MCFDPDSHPPIAPMAGAAIEGRELELPTDGGHRFAAFAGLATEPARSGVVVLPDVRGLHRYYEELVLRLADAGIDAIAIDYFGRTAEGRDRGDGFPFLEHITRTSWNGLQDDVRAAARWLRAERGATSLFSVGFCFGGRLSFLCSTLEDPALSGVIGFYGVPQGPARNDMPAPLDLAGQFRRPVLGLFGGADEAIPPSSVAAFDEALAAADVEHDLITFPDAPHSFFDRKQDQFAAQSAEAWRHVLRFVRAHAGEPTAP